MISMPSFYSHALKLRRNRACIEFTLDDESKDITSLHSVLDSIKYTCEQYGGMAILYTIGGIYRLFVLPAEKMPNDQIKGVVQSLQDYPVTFWNFDRPIY